MDDLNESDSDADEEIILDEELDDVQPQQQPAAAAAAAVEPAVVNEAEPAAASDAVEEEPASRVPSLPEQYIVVPPAEVPQTSTAPAASSGIADLLYSDVSRFGRPLAAPAAAEWSSVATMGGVMRRREA